MLSLIPYIFGLFLNMGYIIEPNTRFLVPSNYKGNANNFYNFIISTYHAVSVVKYCSSFLLNGSDLMVQYKLYHSMSYFISDTYILLLESMIVNLKK